jgi:hypothetical protein
MEKANDGIIALDEEKRDFKGIPLQANILKNKTKYVSFPSSAVFFPSIALSLSLSVFLNRRNRT